MSKPNLDNVGVVILAAGKGSRLNCTDIPKVMLPIGGKPIVSYEVDMLEALGLPPQSIVMVVGFQHEKVRDYFGRRVTFAMQTERKGTAHAAYVGMQALPRDVEHVLVMGGDDGAFYTRESVERFIASHVSSGGVLSLLTADVENPASFGRVVRHDNGDVEVIEKEYTTDEQKKITEVSTGTFCFSRAWFNDMFPNMPELRKLGEYGLPTALAMAREQQQKHQVVMLEDSKEWFGINVLEELEEADKRKQSQ